MDELPRYLIICSDCREDTGPQNEHSFVQAGVAPLSDAIDMFAAPLFYDSAQTVVDSFDASIFEPINVTPAQALIGGGYAAAVTGPSLDLYEMEHWAPNGST